MMQEIKKLLYSSKRELEWKNLKFHLLLHFTDMIVCFGTPKNYDSQHPEYNHRYFVKKPERRFQKQIMVLILKIKLLEG